MMRPTELALRGLGATIPWDDPSATEPSACMFCGNVIPIGQARFPYKPGGGFADWQYLATNSGHLCAACVRFTEAAVMTGTSHCVINQTGKWGLRKDEQLTALLLDPPEPPFVAVWSDTQRAHLLWRATVTTDRNLLRVQFGRDRLTIHRELVLAAYDRSQSSTHPLGWAQELVDLLVAHGEKDFDGAHHPFVSLDRKRENPAHGKLRDKALSLARTDERAKWLIDHLLSLGEGELWALAILAKRNPVEPRWTPLDFRLDAA